MVNRDRKLASNFQNWKISQRYIRIDHNKSVIKWFRDESSIARINLRNSILIYKKDSASQILAKMQYFANYVNQRTDELLSFPAQFQTRVLPEIPQLAIIFRPVQESRSGNYTLHIPHYNGNRIPRVSQHTKGNWWAKFTCQDKASIMVYGSSKTEAIRVATELNRYVELKYKSSQIKASAGFMEHKPNKKIKVKPVRADFYSTGKQNRITPDWRYYFN